MLLLVSSLDNDSVRTVVLYYYQLLGQSAVQNLDNSKRDKDTLIAIRNILVYNDYQEILPLAFYTNNEKSIF